MACILLWVIPVDKQLGSFYSIWRYCCFHSDGAQRKFVCGSAGVCLGNWPICGILSESWLLQAPVLSSQSPTADFQASESATWADPWGLACWQGTLDSFWVYCTWWIVQLAALLRGGRRSLTTKTFILLTIWEHSTAVKMWMLGGLWHLPTVSPNHVVSKLSQSKITRKLYLFLNHPQRIWNTVSIFLF